MGDRSNAEEEIYLLSEHVHPLDKGFELFHLNYRQNDWAEADRVADYILSMAERSYNSRQKWGEVVPLNQMLKHPLIFYFGYGYLAKSIVFQKQGLFDRAREYIAQYADLGWYENATDEDIQEIERFKGLAVANGYAVDLLSGNKEVLKEYNEFIQENDEETLPGFITVFEAANINEWNIDEYYYNIPDQLETFSSFEDLGNRVYYVKLLNQLAIYNINQQRYGIAINYILDYLQTAVTMDLYKEFITTIAMFETVRPFATTEQLTKYQNILQGVRSHEKNISSYVYVDDICSFQSRC
ncbi:DNA-binding protein [Paenibacillus sp. BJ-4]|uniref:DNA-binding protein n=1 Tax=Paenibacillus sp. BJ-4 TaxID=2878097 RepID=UPI001CEFEF8D|nr:DNA-binding protein [Paenibacillus sp. BJ-4]